jgi:hypothetical protein
MMRNPALERACDLRMPGVGWGKMLTHTGQQTSSMDRPVGEHPTSGSPNDIIVAPEGR